MIETVEKEPIDIYNLEQMNTVSASEAIALAHQNPLLASDIYTQRVIENDFFVTVNGEEKELTPGVFVCLRLVMLEQLRATAILNKSAQQHKLELEAAMVVNSTDAIVTPEGRIEN